MKVWMCWFGSTGVEIVVWGCWGSLAEWRSFTCVNLPLTVIGGSQENGFPLLESNSELNPSLWACANLNSNRFR